MQTRLRKVITTAHLREIVREQMASDVKHSALRVAGVEMRDQQAYQDEMMHGKNKKEEPPRLQSFLRTKYHSPFFDAGKDNKIKVTIPADAEG